jgi:hypothetical protein
MNYIYIVVFYINNIYRKIAVTYQLIFKEVWTMGSVINQMGVNASQSQFNQRLSQGVRSGSINRDEFMSLEKYDQQTHQMEGQFMRDGNLSPEEKQILDSRMAQSNQMMNMYSSGDFHPFSQAPMNPMQARMDNQLNSTYSGIRDGSLGGAKFFSGDEGAQSLNRLGDISTNYGRYGMAGGPSMFGMNFGPNINQQLNDSRSSINDLRGNWNTSPPSMLPDDASWGPNYGIGSGTFGVNPFMPYGLSGFPPFGQSFSF